MTAMNEALELPIVKRADIVEGVRQLGIQQSDGLFAHASLSAFGDVHGGAEAVGEALLEAVGEDGTVVLPTFTWARHIEQTEVCFDLRRHATECGAIPEAFRKRPEARRSDHICHSVSVAGKLRDEMMGEGVRPFGKGSSLYRLYEHDFWYLFLGVNFSCCTALHTAEELQQVPYRYYRHYQDSTVLRENGEEVPSKAVDYVLYRPYHYSFRKAQAVFEKAGVLRSVQVGNARLIATKARTIIDMGQVLLDKDEGFFLLEESQRYLAAVKAGALNLE